jgi:transposase-like protein
MPVVWVKFSSKIDPKNVSTGKLSECPQCGGNQLQRWGKIDNLETNNGESLRISRFRCADCGRTFSDPVKLNYKIAYQETLLSVAGMIWVLGFSLREIEALFRDLGVDISRSSIWRCGKKMVTKLNCPETKGQRLEIDPLYISGISEQLGVVIGLEISDGRQVVLGALPEPNPRIVMHCLKDLLGDSLVELEIRSDTAVRNTELTHELCPFVLQDLSD